MQVLASVPVVKDSPMETGKWRKVRSLFDEDFGKEYLIDNIDSSLLSEELPARFRLRRLSKAKLNGASPCARSAAFVDLALHLQLRDASAVEGVARVLGVWQDSSYFYVGLEAFANSEVLQLKRDEAVVRHAVARMYRALHGMQSIGFDHFELSHLGLPGNRVHLNLSLEAFALGEDGLPQLAHFRFLDDRYLRCALPELGTSDVASLEDERKGDVYRMSATVFSLLSGRGVSLVSPDARQQLQKLLDVAGLHGDAHEFLRLAFEDADRRPSVEDLLKSKFFAMASVKTPPVDDVDEESSARAEGPAKGGHVASAADKAAQDDALVPFGAWPQ